MSHAVHAWGGLVATTNSSVSNEVLLKLESNIQLLEFGVSLVISINSCSILFGLDCHVLVCHMHLGSGLLDSFLLLFGLCSSGASQCFKMWLTQNLLLSWLGLSQCYNMAVTLGQTHWSHKPCCLFFPPLVLLGK